MNSDEQFVDITINDKFTILGDKFTDKCLDFYHEVKHSVTDHKRVFGKQIYCFNGSGFRFWVWDSFYFWRVLVNNKVGVIFEVRYDISEEETLRCWNEYTSHMSGKSI